MLGEKIKILDIAGWDRSGSTILDLILGQFPGLFSVGELIDMWERGPETLCGCGRVFKDCETWREIFLEAFGVLPGRFDFATGANLQRHCARSRHLYVLGNPLLRKHIIPMFDSYRQLVEKLYRAVSTVSGARLLVDSSKQPVHAYLLQLMGIAELHVVHLVRDPRGCAYSYQKRKPHPALKEGYFPSMHPARNSMHWILANVATEVIWKRSPERYLLVRYEDFIARPKHTVHRILEFAGEQDIESPFSSEHSVFLRPLHGVSGNSVRFQTGALRLSLDDKWKSEMKGRHRAMVATLTSTILRKYGYNLGRFGRDESD